MHSWVQPTLRSRSSRSLRSDRSPSVAAVAFYFAGPARAAKPLGAVKQFIADNNATIMMVILLILGAKVLGDALSGVWS